MSQLLQVARKRNVDDAQNGDAHAIADSFLEGPARKVHRVCAHDVPGHLQAEPSPTVMTLPPIIIPLRASCGGERPAAGGEALHHPGSTASEQTPSQGAFGGFSDEQRCALVDMLR